MCVQLDHHAPRRSARQHSFRWTDPPVRLPANRRRTPNTSLDRKGNRGESFKKTCMPCYLHSVANCAGRLTDVQLLFPVKRVGVANARPHAHRRSLYRCNGCAPPPQRNSSINSAWNFVMRCAKSPGARKVVLKCSVPGFCPNPEPGTTQMPVFSSNRMA